MSFRQGGNGERGLGGLNNGRDKLGRNWMMTYESQRAYLYMRLYNTIVEVGKWLADLQAM